MTAPLSRQPRAASRWRTSGWTTPAGQGQDASLESPSRRAPPASTLSTTAPTRWTCCTNRLAVASSQLRRRNRGVAVVSSKDRSHMLRTISRSRVLLPLPAMAVMTAVVMGISLFAASARANVPSDPRASVHISAGHDLFEPFILPVAPNTTVTWNNADSRMHAVVTTPQRSAFLNPVPLALHLAPGGSASYTFTTPGLYDYYDTGEAAWNQDDGHVAALAQAPDFPLAMEGVIWVRGPIRGLPAVASNLIPGRDLFATDFLAIIAGGSVRFHDADTDRHVVVEVPGWRDDVNPTPVTPLEL